MRFRSVFAACRFVVLEAIFFFFWIPSATFRQFSACGFVAFLGRFGLGFRWCLGLFGSTADELHFCLSLG